ncbi:MAG: ribosome silencing factor [Methylobacteriaceae bacterium]|nr:ribosome silencing factor [Methylobacteriaceae bacterium]
MKKRVAPRAGAVAPATPDAAEAAARLTALVRAALDDGKAEDVVTLELAGKTTLADAMVIASGRSSTQVAALAERVAKGLKEAGRPAPRIEGLPQADWVLIDAGDVIVHVFRPEVRQFYNLEKMWGGDRPSEPRLAARA